MESPIESTNSDNFYPVIETTVGTTDEPTAPVHRVMCTSPSCPCGATYRANSTGTGFIVLERSGMDIDATLGVGPNARPECPRGHGEMALADEQLPVGEAFSQVNERIEEARRLPFPSPPFNYEGALHSIFAKRREIAKLDKRVNDRKEKLTEAKDERDQQVETIGKMIDEFERAEKDRNDEIERRTKRAESGEPEPCTFTAKHGTECTLCAAVPDIVLQMLGREPAAKDAAAHVDDVERFNAEIEIEITVDALREAGIIVTADQVRPWTITEQTIVRDWATASYDHQQGREVVVPARPVILGTAHIAGAGRNDEAQACTLCGQVLIAGGVLIATGEFPNYITEGALVGVDCPGANAAEHHYSAKKKTGRRKKGESA